VVIAGAFDRVEIGDVGGRERMDRQEPAQDIERITGRRQRRADRPVVLALSEAGADHHAAPKIKDGNEFHGSDR